MTPWLTAMRELAGTREFAGGADNPVILGMATTIARRWPEMAAYCANYQHDATPWCGLAVAYCLAKNGIRPPFGASDTQRFLWAQSFASWGTRLSAPRVGCIAVFRWANGSGHTGIVAAVHATTVDVIGGNQDNGVNTKPFATTHVIAWIWPPGAQATIESEPMTWTFEATKLGYSNLWRSATLKGGADATNAETFARKIIAAEDRYRKVQAATGVPWFFIGALHMREDSCSFAGVLHNGDRIIGTGGLTTHVPAGRGPFSTWEESAVDALKLKNLHRVQDWSVARMLYSAEVYNGLGYVSHGVNSPYVWAGTNQEQRGKYISDHNWDPNADDAQLGVAAVLIRLAQLRPDIAAALNPQQQEPPVTEPNPQPNNQTIDLDLLADKFADALVNKLRAAGLQFPAAPALPPPEPKPEPPPPATPPATDAVNTGSTALGFLGLILAALGHYTGVMPVVGDAAGTVGPAVAGTSIFATLGGALGATSPILSVILKMAGGAFQALRKPV